MEQEVPLKTEQTFFYYGLEVGYNSIARCFLWTFSTHIYRIIGHQPRTRATAR